MATQSKHWQELVQPHCARFRMTAYLGQSVSINSKGCEAYANLLADMAVKLDTAVDMQTNWQREVEELKELVKLTTQGNHV